MIEIIKTIIYGIVEGITEWLPVSSTGHLIILNEIMPLNVSQDFWNVFEVVIQLGAIFSVILLYFNKLWPFSLKEKNLIKKDTFNIWFKILVSCVPAAIIGILFDEVFEKLFYNTISVSIALIVVGILFIFIEKFNKKESTIKSISEMTYKAALTIGLFQLIAAIFPGVSRSGATILGAIMIGVNRVTAAEYTFFLAIPVMLGASLLKLLKFGFAFTTLEFAILVTGMIASFLTSLFVIKFLMNYVKKHDFKIFGFYRIVLGIIMILLVLSGVIWRDLIWLMSALFVTIVVKK